MTFPNTRYIFDPQPNTSTDKDILDAVVAVYPPLYSLDVIPERLRYMFREEGLSQAEVPAAHFKLALSADEVKADDLGWIHSLKFAEPTTSSPSLDVATTGDSFTISGKRIDPANVTGQTTSSAYDSLHNQIARAVETWLNDDENGETLVANVVNIADEFISERDTLNAEVERLRAEWVKWHETHPPSICSAHDRVQLDCPICNPALAMLKTAMEERDALRLKYGEF